MPVVISGMPAYYVVLVAAALGSLLVPSGHMVPLMIAAPLAVAAVRGRDDKRFLLWAVYALGYVAFVHLRGYVHLAGLVPVQWQYVVTADRVIGLGELPTHALQRWLYVPGQITALTTLSIITHGSFFFLQSALAVVLWLAKAPHWPRYIRASVITWAVSLVLILLLPTAPPWMVSSDGDVGQVHRVLYDVFTRTAPAVYEYGLAVAGENPVAAMPSLHFAGALLVSVGLWHWHWTARVPAVVYSGMMAFALVYLGEHWVIDIVVAAVIVAAAWRVAR